MVRIARLRAAVDARLGELLEGPDRPQHRLAAAMRYALLSPGKRLRPVLALLTAWRLGADELAGLDPACALEMVHAASLILDDMPCMDDTPTRRGSPATHVRYGEAVATLAAVALLNQAYAVVAQTPGLPAAARLEMVRALTEAVGFDGLVAGQERDLRNEADLSLDGLSDLHHRKTGVLFLAAVRIGALVADAPEREAGALTRFATELGLAFQAADDLSDGPDSPESTRGAHLLSLLGPEGARREAHDRLHAAKSALESGGGSLATLRPYIDAMLPAG